MHNNLMKLSHVVFKLCEWPDKQTVKQTDIFVTKHCIPPGGEIELLLILITIIHAYAKHAMSIILAVLMSLYIIITTYRVGQKIKLLYCRLLKLRQLRANLKKFPC